MVRGQIISDRIEVFISYSHNDEPLRNELEKHLSILKRQGLISTWHDRNISAGEEWKGQIDEHLDSAQIILLLISADFLASDYCYDIELKRAIERHDVGDARVIPIILRPVEWKGAPFGRLEALPTNAEPITSKKWGSLDEALADVARGLKGTLESIPRPPKSPPNGPKKLIVDQMGRGNYALISDAIKAADPGDIILVRPGLYEEGIQIDKPLEIVGEGERDDIELRAMGIAHAIAFKAPTGRVANLTVRQMSDSEFCCVDISRGRLILEQCDLSSKGDCCISIHDYADPRIRRNNIHNNKNGIIITEHGQGLLEDNDISENPNSDIQILKGGNPTLRRNRIHDGKGNGVLVIDNGLGILEDNDIFGHELPQVAVEAGGNPTLRRNRIHDAKGDGVRVNNSGLGILEDNDIYGHESPQIAIDTGGNPTLRRNRIHDAKSNGVRVTDNGLGILEDNDIYGHESPQIAIDAGGNPTLRRNRIHDGNDCGVYIYNNGLGIFEDNEIFGHVLSQVIVHSGGNPTLRRNRIHDGKSFGISIDNGHGTFEENDLRNNKKGAWDISGKSKSYIQRIKNIE